MKCRSYFSTSLVERGCTEIPNLFKTAHLELIFMLIYLSTDPVNSMLNTVWVIDSTKAYHIGKLKSYIITSCAHLEMGKKITYVPLPIFSVNSHIQRSQHIRALFTSLEAEGGKQAFLIKLYFEL